MKRLMVLLSICLVSSLAVSPAQAHFKIKRPNNLKEKPLKVRQFFWHQNYKHAHKVIIRINKTTKDLKVVRSTQDAHREHRLVRVYRNHHWLMETAERHLQAIKREIKLSYRPPHYHEWMCIHSYEGAWDDPNAPYYGGLQMDIHFQRHYGYKLLTSKGTADNWTPLEQMWVAERAYKSGRGFNPWPNTARYCGLLN